MLKIFMEFLSMIINNTILHLACESGYIDIVKYIISLNKIDINLETIFMELFQIKFRFLIDFIQFRKNNNFHGVYKIIMIYNTLLHLACRSGNIELVKYIISLNKIDITSSNIFTNFKILNKVSNKS